MKLHRKVQIFELHLNLGKIQLKSQQNQNFIFDYFCWTLQAEFDLQDDGIAF